MSNKGRVQKMKMLQKQFSLQFYAWMSLKDPICSMKLKESHLLYLVWLFEHQLVLPLNNNLHSKINHPKEIVQLISDADDDDDVF